MRRSFTLNDIKSPTFKKDNFDYRVKFTVVNGEVIDNEKAPERSRLQQATSVLSNKRLGTFVNGATDADISINMLEAVGCCLVGRDKNFSLLNDQTDKENIENPNILDEANLKKIKSKKTKPDDKFSNPNDPFYQLDGAPSRATQLSSKEIKSQEKSVQIAKLGADLANLNSSSRQKPKLKYFT